MGLPSDAGSLVNTLILSCLGGLIGWFSQDMRKRMSNVERRLGASTRALFYLVQNDRRGAPHETLRALEEAMKESK